MEESAFRVAIYVFRNLTKKQNELNKFKFIIKKQFRSLFHLSYNNVILIKNTEFEDRLSDENKILEKISNVKYDLIIDLNYNFHLGISRLISFLQADLKVGFKTPFSDFFYNIQLDVSKSEVIEKGYKQVNMMI